MCCRELLFSTDFCGENPQQAQTLYALGGVIFPTEPYCCFGFFCMQLTLLGALLQNVPPKPVAVCYPAWEKSD